MTSSQGVRQWLVDGQWTFSEKLRKNKARLVPNVFDEYAQASLVDAISLSIAASESAYSFSTPRRGGDDRGCAWRLISVYYAAFFSANALMRLCGYACTNINVIECAAVNEMALLTGFRGSSDSQKLTQGIYFVRPLAADGSIISVDILNGPGGLHIQFWVGFKRFLDDLKSSISASGRLRQEKQAAQAEINALIDGLSHGSAANGSWLSEIRNAVNYRFDFGSWFPYEGSGAGMGEISGILEDAVRNDRVALPERATAVPEIVRAAHLSAALLKWLQDSLRVIEATSAGRKRTLVSNGALHMLAAI